MAKTAGRTKRDTKNKKAKARPTRKGKSGAKKPRMAVGPMKRPEAPAPNPQATDPGMENPAGWVKGLA